MTTRNPVSQTPAAPVWRQFSFFDLSNVTDPQDLGRAPEAFRSLVPPYVLISPSPSSLLAGSISTIISTANGEISLLDHRFQTIKRFRGWDSAVADTGAIGGDVSDKGKSRAGAASGKGKEKGVMLLECGGVLLGIGEDDSPTQQPILKIWDLMHEDKKTREPLLMRVIRIGGAGSSGSGARGFSVSSISTTSNLSYLAIGLISGQVLLYRHLSQSLLTSPLALTSFPKPRVVMEGSMAEPITGLGFREPHAVAVVGSDGEGVHGDNGGKKNRSTTGTGTTTTERTSLFVTTPNKTFVIPTIAGKGSEPVLLEELGAGIGCTSISSTKRELIVGRDDGIYMYGLEGRGSVFAYEGEKSDLRLFKSSVVIVSPPFAPSAGSQSATIRRAAASAAAASAAAGGLSNAAKVTVFDLVNKFVAYSGVFKEGVREVFSDGEGTVYVVGGDGKLSRLVEQSIATKLDVLHRKSLYQLSVQLAKSAGMSESEVADIYAKYGDHLYSKGDFDGAMSQLVKTLGFVQPSYVIRKFLDGQRIHNLTTYLQELHSRGLANADHTTLLLNCYTKTADKARLDHFIKTETSKSNKDAELPFDLETAIRVCRQAGFYEHAVYLAKKYGRHEDYLRIQLEDAGDFADALTYIRQLDPKMAEQNLLSYGKQMLKHQPDPTTDLLIDLCSGSLLRKRKRAVAEAAQARAVALAEKAPAGAPAYLSYLGYDQVVGLIGAGGSEKQGENGQPSLGVEGSEVSRAAASGANGGSLPPPVDDSDTIYKPPSSRPFFPHFIDHPQQFIRFLETVAAERWGHALDNAPRRQNSYLHSPPLDMATNPHNDPQQKDQRAIWNTLFELYLADAVNVDSTTAERSHEKAMAVLLQADQLPLDPMHALILCSTNNFTAGLVRLWEKLGMYEDVLRFWMAQTGQDKVEGRIPSENVLHHLNVYGPSNPRLYPLVLRYLSSTNALLARHTKDLREILQIIDEERIMPALSVVQLLSRNGVTGIGVVKDWLRAKVAETKQDIDSDKQLVTSYRSETADKLKEISELSDPARPQVFQVTRCASCGGQLDLPSVHFMCKHSYHQRCLPDSDPECPACARQFAVIREVRRNQQALAERHDLFLSEVEEAQDGFAVVAGAYGRGLFSKQVRDVPA